MELKVKRQYELGKAIARVYLLVDTTESERDKNRVLQMAKKCPDMTRHGFNFLMREAGKDERI